MKTITKASEATYREKGSKFLGYLYPAKNKDEVEEHLDALKSTYPDATHHCYAFRLDPTKPKEFAQDDGEPGGTAGLPILNTLKSHKLINVVLFVVRYYGGTKLGKSGLIGAYGHTAELCVTKATLRNVIPTQNVEINFPYNRQNQIDRLKTNFELVELQSEYLADVTMKVACPMDDAEQFVQQLEKLEHLGISFEELEQDYLVR